MSNASNYLLNYTAEDGGGKLKLNDVHPPFPGQVLNTTNNENPILFQVQTTMELLKTEYNYYFEFKTIFERHMHTTQIEPGLHSRRGGDYIIRRQSHDNVVAMVIGSWYYNTDHRYYILSYCVQHWFNYNVTHDHSFDLKSQIQGGDAALCYYACNVLPPLPFALWLAIGLATTTAFNLADLRLEFLEATMHTLPLAHRLLLKVGIYFHKKRRGPRINWVRDFFKGSQHPFLLAVEDSVKV